MRFGPATYLRGFKITVLAFLAIATDGLPPFLAIATDGLPLQGRCNHQRERRRDANLAAGQFCLLLVESSESMGAIGGPET